MCSLGPESNYEVSCTQKEKEEEYNKQPSILPPATCLSTKSANSFCCIFCSFNAYLNIRPSLNQDKNCFGSKNSCQINFYFLSKTGVHRGLAEGICLISQIW